MVNKRVRCPHCASLRTKKKGMQHKKQRYGCNDCGRRFQIKRENKKLSSEIWQAYAREKQTLKELAHTYGKSHVWVRQQLDRIDIPVPTTPSQPTVIIADTTFWGKRYGVMVFRSWTLRTNIWWGEVATEKVAHYHYARKLLESSGWTFTAAVIDGRRGLANVFKDIPVQVCQFHQLQTVTKYLTRRPKTAAGKELRTLALTLTTTDEQTFAQALKAYEARHAVFLNEKTIILGLKRPQYSTSMFALLCVH